MHNEHVTTFLKRTSNGQTAKTIRKLYKNKFMSTPEFMKALASFIANLENLTRKFNNFRPQSILHSGVAISLLIFGFRSKSVTKNVRILPGLITEVLGLIRILQV